MIHHLYIKDFAVIDQLDLSFGSGLNLLTGETGSGKSIIVDAIGIALGERADSDTVRGGCDKALVEVVLDASDSSEPIRIMEEAGISTDDEQIIISREISKNGKSQCRINGRPATVSLLKSITDRLVDTHGQHEHQFLLKPEHHMPVLDAWCGSKADVLKADIAGQYAHLCELRRRVRQLKSDERERARLIDLYQFQSDEILSAKLIPGEEEDLESEKLILANAEKLNESASTAYELIRDRGDDGCALDILGDALNSIQDIVDIDPQLQPLVETMQSAIYQVEDAARELRAYRDTVEFNPERLKEADDRLDLLRTLKKKYGDTIEEIIEYGKELSEKLNSLMNNEEMTQTLDHDINKSLADVLSLAEELSAIRRAGAVEFTNRIENELAGLGMQNAVFRINIEKTDLDSTGIDKIEFLISANPGEDPKPLAKIASGGEMSRIMLAIKSVMASIDQIPTLIFDEIDVGVGGRTAEVIADKLEFLSGNAQVFCITHLPQIACRPGEHFAIEKQTNDGRTSVSVRRLDRDDRVNEISRMLGGAKPTDTAIRHAMEMLGYA